MMIDVMRATNAAGHVTTIHQSAPMANHNRTDQAASNPHAIQIAVLCGVQVMPSKIVP